MRFIIHPFWAGMCLFAAIISLVLTGSALLNGIYIPMFIYLAFALLYIGLSIHFGSSATIDENGIRYRGILKKKKALTWAEIKEISVLNLKILNNYEKERIGSLYICFFDRTPTDEEKLGICLKWPPKDIIYLHFNVERYKKIQEYYTDKITLFYLKEEVFLDKYFSDKRKFINRITPRLPFFRK